MTKLQILGTGCPKCKKLAELTEEAARSLGIEYEIEKVTEIPKIMSFGVMLTIKRQREYVIRGRS